MNYKSMTKEKLIELVKDGRHLKSAIEAKDKEINELKVKVSNVSENLKDELVEKEKLIELVKDGRHLKSAIEAKDKEINELKVKVSNVSENLKDELVEKEKLIELVKDGRHLKSAIEAKDKEINELKVKVGDVRKTLNDKYENETNNLKKKLRDSELSIEVLADKKLSDIKNSYERNEKQLRLDAKNAAEIAIKKAKELEELLELLKSVQRAFQGSLDMSINLTSYFEDKVTKGE